MVAGDRPTTRGRGSAAVDAVRTSDWLMFSVGRGCLVAGFERLSSGGLSGRPLNAPLRPKSQSALESDVGTLFQVPGCPAAAP
jgi:hypothetical protein